MPAANVSSKPLLSMNQIINMSVGFFGIQFLFGLQNGNMSRIFQSLGAKIDDIPILWIAAPITGLLVQPIIGHFSDKTWLGKWGRRRPYFLAGALLAALALLFFPSVKALFVAAILLWILDASINISMEPFRAFVGDMLPDSQRTMGFSMQVFFIGIGAVLSSFMPSILTYFGVSNEAPIGSIPDTIKISFYIGVAVVIASIAWTVFTVKEYSPAEMKSFGEYDDEPMGAVHIKTPAAVFMKNGVRWGLLGLGLTLALYLYNNSVKVPLEKELYVLSGGVLFFGLFQLVAYAFARNKNNNGLVEVADDLNNLNSTMKKLAVVQFFSWFALFSMWIYSSPALAQHLAGTTDTASKAYNNIGNHVGNLFAVYNLASAFFAFLLPVLAKRLGKSVTHMISLVAGGIGLITFFLFKDKNLLYISMIGIGLAWASILAMPYAILTKSLPAKKMGVYMGIFNFFIVIPQILAATLLGFLTKHLFDGQAIYTIVVGGVSMIVGGVFALRLKDSN
jgi:maltose/moltooligosaccharide transporter